MAQTSKTYFRLTDHGRWYLEPGHGLSKREVRDRRRRLIHWHGLSQDRFTPERLRGYASRKVEAINRKRGPVM